ncbi:winged helix-turn-helix domain-containing protein [Flavobacterium sasangense]|uniref:winged helix-turn-helix domain-containing protein n=1 Tax=Flavobacterium sasangense TaxID=503361 RepID=UPI00047D3AE5|nr:winged helix-turn-helix domain-containing protein [Flavobacterium sasangense]
MNSRQKLLFGKTKYIIALLLLVLISLVFFVNNANDFDLSRREVLLRRIGHEILLQSGDSTSRVLPIKKIAENEYQISFEKEFSFVTDSIVNTTKRLLIKDYQVTDYVVNVINCANSSVTYGYAISKNKKEDILACVGRKQPIACYKINIKFKPNDIVTTNYKYYLGGLSFLLLIGFVFWKFKHKKQLPKIDNNKLFTFGSVVFDAQKRQLEINKETIDLTATETRLLLIFASSPNETIERSRLQKEIWEDEGVIVGRSLDMFISKLRKKLELDPNINIVVIRGKGYKLEIRE